MRRANSSGSIYKIKNSRRRKPWVVKITTRYLDLLKQYDGVITPDCTMAIGQSKCLQQANTYMNQAVGFYLQKNGIPVIPNVRWSDESSFEYYFLGIPKKGNCFS